MRIGQEDFNFSEKIVVFVSPYFSISLYKELDKTWVTLKGIEETAEAYSTRCSQAVTKVDQEYTQIGQALSFSQTGTLIIRQTLKTYG